MRATGRPAPLKRFQTNDFLFCRIVRWGQNESVTSIGRRSAQSRLRLLRSRLPNGNSWREPVACDVFCRGRFVSGPTQNGAGRTKLTRSRRRSRPARTSRTGGQQTRSVRSCPSIPPFEAGAPEGSPTGASQFRHAICGKTIGAVIVMRLAMCRSVSQSVNAGTE